MKVLSLGKERVILLSQYIGDLMPDAQVKGLFGLNLTACTFSKISAIFKALSLSYIMGQKYKVFIDKSCVFFDIKKKSNWIDLTKTIPKNLEDLKDILCHKNGFVNIAQSSETLENYFKNFKKIIAAGGIIFFKNHVLMIYRNQKWDFPKGKIEKGESFEQAAIRECIEECGLEEALIIQHKLNNTYHCYREKNVDYLKETHWYVMRYHGCKKLTPQVDENIEKAEWFNNIDFIKNMKNSYETLKVLQKELLEFTKKSKGYF